MLFLFFVLGSAGRAGCLEAQISADNCKKLAEFRHGFCTLVPGKRGRRIYVASDNRPRMLCLVCQKRQKNNVKYVVVVEITPWMKPKGAKSEPKDAKWEPKGTKMEPKSINNPLKWFPKSTRAPRSILDGQNGTKTDPKWSQKASKIYAKSLQKSMLKSMPKRCRKMEPKWTKIYPKMVQKLIQNLYFSCNGDIAKTLLLL